MEGRAGMAAIDASRPFPGEYGLATLPCRARTAGQDKQALCRSALSRSNNPASIRQETGKWPGQQQHCLAKQAKRMTMKLPLERRWKLLMRACFFGKLLIIGVYL
jgi:hypothetical protein